jgi:hypothetical protein
MVAFMDPNYAWWTIEQRPAMSADNTIYACVRARKIRDLRHLGRIQSHGLRRDPSAQQRVVAERTGRTPAHSIYSPDEPLRLVRAYRTAKEVLGAVEYGGAAVGLHLIIILSAPLIAERGDPHDADNPLNRKLVSEGTAWAEAAFGEGSVIASRLDLDEAGWGELDVIVVPARMTRMNARSSKVIISVNAALEEIRSQHGDETSYGALQTSWALHAKAHIDSRIERGVPKEQTQRLHVSADVYRHVAEEMKAAQKEIQDSRDSAHADQVAVEEERCAVESAKAALLYAEQELEERRAAAAKATAEALEERAQLERDKAASDLAARALRDGVDQAERAKAAAQQERDDLQQKEAKLARERSKMVAIAERLRTADIAIKSQVETASRASIGAVGAAVDAFLDGRIEALEGPIRPGDRLRVHFASQVSTEEKETILGDLRRGRQAGLIPLLLRVQSLISEAEILVEDRRTLEPGPSIPR